MFETKLHVALWVLVLAGSGAACGVESRPFDEDTDTAGGTTASETTASNTGSSEGTVSDTESSSSSSSSGGPGDSDGSGPSETTGTSPATCPTLTVDDPLPAAFEVDFVGADIFSCRGEEEDSRPDISVVWTAPSDGLFSVQTAQTLFQHSSFVLRGDCMGTTQLCPGKLEEYAFTDQTWFSAAQDETVTIVLQAESGEVGPYNFELREEVCPTEVLDAPHPVQLTRTVDTQSLPAQFAPKCGPGLEGGVGFTLFEWTPGADGSYRFSATGDYQELEVRESTCYGDALGCSLHPQRKSDPQPTIDVDLIAGQTVVAVVSGYGEFELSISDAE